MTDQNEHDSADMWEVVVAEPYDRGDRSQGAQETSIVQGPEAEARRVFADRTAEAGELGYEYVKLRFRGDDVESWPQATGWTC